MGLVQLSYGCLQQLGRQLTNESLEGGLKTADVILLYENFQQAQMKQMDTYKLQQVSFRSDLFLV